MAKNRNKTIGHINLRLQITLRFNWGMCFLERVSTTPREQAARLSSRRMQPLDE